MKTMLNILIAQGRRWGRHEGGVAYIEFSMIFPVMMVMLIGIFDVGNAILVNQKAVSAAQMVADLITRQEDVSTTELDQALMGGQLALMPFSTQPYGIDVISYRYDQNDDPQQLWRETRNMTPLQDPDKTVKDLGVSGDGVVMVTVTYEYSPTFWKNVFGNISMSETAFARGRLSATVTRGS